MKARRIFYLVLLLAAATAGAYSTSFRGKFVMDDIGRIVESTFISDLPAVARTMSTRYLVELSFALDFARGGLNPAYYHFTNLVIHLLCGLVLMLLVRKLLLISGKAEKLADWAAFISALLWSVHPLTTSAVTYICQRYESMMSLMMLLSMFLLVLGGTASGWRSQLLLVCSLLSWSAGMLSKEIMITAPVLLLALDASFIAGGPLKALRARWLYYLLLALGTGGMLAYIGASSDNLGTMVSAYSARYGSLIYLLNQSGVILQYLSLVFWPDPLTLDYAWQPVLESSRLLLPVTIVAGLFLTTLYGLIRWPKAFYAGFAAFVILAPTSSIVPVPDLAFEHRMYLPLACVITSIVLSVTYLARSRRAKAGACFAALLVAVVLASATVVRNSVYAEPEELWGDIVERIPHNFRAWSFLTNAKLEAGKYAEAEMSAREMLACVQLVRLDTNAVYNIPSSQPDMYEALGRDALGQALLAQGRAREALGLFSQVVEEHPDDRAARHNKALALLALGRRAEAERELDMVLQVHGGFKESSMVKAQLMTESGRYKDAILVLNKTLKVYPGFVPARVELAWLLVTVPVEGLRDSGKALKLLQGIEDDMGMTSVRLLDVRAAVLAESGNFEQAVRLQEIAVKDAQEYHPGDTHNEELKQRLVIYKDGRPFRLPSGAEKVQE